MRNFIERFLGIVVAIVLTAAALIFASFILALAAGIALVLGGWLWWRTRDIRRELARQEAEQREAAARRPGPAPGAVIEGEYRKIDER